MKLTYIYHSGFAIETERMTIIIDYYKDSDNNKSKGVVYSRMLKRTVPLYVLCSHSHADHFNPEILDWEQQKSDIKYILSKDIEQVNKSHSDKIVYLDKGDRYEDNLLKIRAYGSTDLGISFYIETGNKHIFHAGDLNNWHWKEESTDEEVKEAECWYLRELNLVTSEITHLDLAMFPVDPRLGKEYMKGAEQFISKIKTNLFSPMHFGEKYGKAAAFASIAQKYGCECICWEHRGESLDF